MFEVRQTAPFRDWLAELRDRASAAIIAARIARVGRGNLGEVKPVGDGVSELRVHVGPGYRLYFVQRGARLIILLCGSDRGGQAKAIKQAKQLAQEVEE